MSQFNNISEVIQIVNNNDNRDDLYQSRASRLTNNIFLNKKCWICLAILDFDQEDQAKIQKFFNEQNSLFLSSKPTNTRFSNSNIKPNKIKIRLFKDKYVMSACKCRKKLAHKQCFNNYIDLKQNGNVKIDINCSQCNFKYEFYYKYNNLFLKTMDVIEVALNGGSYFLTTIILFLSTYWCCLSYGGATVIQMYGYEKSFEMLKNTTLGSKILLFITLPLLPIGLVASRFISWEQYFIRLLHFGTFLPRRRKSTNTDEIETDRTMGIRCLSSMRLVLGGLMLPTIAIAIDNYIIKSFLRSLIKSTLIRTSLAGLAFVAIKGILKIAYFYKKKLQKSRREIQNSKF